MLRYAELIMTDPFVPFGTTATHVIRELFLTTAPITVRLRIVIFPIVLEGRDCKPRDALSLIIVEFTKYCNSVILSAVTEHTNFAVDPKHTVVLTGVWINAEGEVIKMTEWSVSQCLMRINMYLDVL